MFNCPSFWIFPWEVCLLLLNLKQKYTLKFYFLQSADETENNTLREPLISFKNDIENFKNYYARWAVCYPSKTMKEFFKKVVHYVSRYLSLNNDYENLKNTTFAIVQKQWLQKKNTTRRESFAILH